MIPHCSWAGSKASGHMVLLLSSLNLSPVSSLTILFEHTPQGMKGSFPCLCLPKRHQLPLDSGMPGASGTLKIQPDPPAKDSYLFHNPQAWALGDKAPPLLALALSSLFPTKSLCLWCSKHSQGRALVLSFTRNHNEVF